jgi:multiple sugar transport system permease protein
VADAEPDLSAGYGSRHGQSPVLNGASHLILLAATLLFLLPLAWMASTSVKPLDQTMSLPPTFVPRANFATLEGKQRIVVKERLLQDESCIVIPEDGHEKGKRKLVARKEIDASGKALMKFAQGGREVYEQNPVLVRVVKEVPANSWLVKEWAPEFSSEREKSKQELLWDCVPESELSSVPHAFWGNYNSALERMKGIGNQNAAWYSVGFVRYLLNTLFVCLLSVIGAVSACTLVAYAFAFLEFPGKTALFAVTLGVMMVPFPATMVPLYDVFHSLGWIGTFKPLWVPAWFGGAFFIFLLRQFFLGLPKDLLDAARIDGCSELEIVWHVVVPLARPALAMVALFQFIGSWKDFMGPMVYLQDSTQFTLSLGLQSFYSQQGGTPWHYVMAASMLFSMPLIVLFLLARKTFMRGIAMTGLKG